MVIINIYSPLLPIVLFLIFFSKSHTEKGLWVIFLYCCYSFLTDKVLFNLPILEKYVYSFFTLIEFLAFSLFLWLNVASRTIKNIIGLSPILFTLFISIYFFSVEFNTIDSIPIGIETILVIAFSIIFFYEQINKPALTFIYNKYEFWIIVGFLIYLAGSFFVYIYANQVSEEDFKKISVIPFIFNIIKNLLFSIAILIHVRQANNSTPMHEHPQPFLN